MGRLRYIDNIKGFAICLVILGHITQFNENLSNLTNWIYSFHIPLFFIVSGYLSSLSNTKISILNMINKKWKSLMVPYIWFSIINFSMKTLFILFSSGLNKEVLTYEICRVITFYGNGTVWFLACLFFVETLYKLLETCISNKNMRTFICLLLSILAMNIKSENILIISMARVIISLGFYTVGHQYIQYINNVSYKYTKIVPIFLIIANFLICISQNSRVDLYSLQLQNIPIYVLTSILGSAGVIMLFRYNKLDLKFNMFNILGTQSLILMLVHVRIMDAIKVLMNKIGLNNINYMIYTFILFTLVVGISYIGVIIINKYFYFMIGKERNKPEVQYV